MDGATLDVIQDSSEAGASNNALRIQRTRVDRVEPMLPNKPRGVRRVDDRRVRDGIVWVLRSGAPWRRPMVPHDLLQSLRSVNDTVVALICPTCQRSTSGTRRVPATVHGVVFNILTESADPG
jgi:hypothetical protein